MRTQSKWVINLVYNLLTIVWYVNIILAIIGFSALVLNFTTKEYTTMNIPVKVKHINNMAPLAALSPSAESVSAQTEQVTIQMKLKVNTWIIIEAFAFFIAIEALIMLVLYHLRKIFMAIKSEEPFQFVIVHRLRIVAVCLFASTALKVIWGWADYATLATNVKDFSRQFMMIWSDNFMGIIIGTLLYVIAEVFRYGIELKHENEAFV